MQALDNVTFWPHNKIDIVPNSDNFDPHRNFIMALVGARLRNNNKA